MARVIRHFGVTSSGTGDGVLVADRAALIVGGNWNDIIRDFDFGGADVLECRLQAGAYSGLSQTLAAAAFTVAAPTTTRAIYFVTADGAGDIAELPDPTWCSTDPPWPTIDSQFAYLVAVITANSAVQICSTSHASFYNMAFVGSHNGQLFSAVGTKLDWVQITNNGSGTGAICTVAPARNSVVKCTGTGYDCCLRTSSGAPMVHNVRAEGNNAATTGNRCGFRCSGNILFVLSNCTAHRHPGLGGYRHSTNNANSALQASNCIAYDCETGFSYSSSTPPTAYTTVLNNCIAVECGTAISTNFNIIVSGGRYRNNTAFISAGDHALYNIIDSAGTDAAEFVEASKGEFRIKNNSDIWNKNCGPCDQKLLHALYHGENLIGAVYLA